MFYHTPSITAHARPKSCPLIWAKFRYVEALENEKYNYKRGYTENIGVRKPWRGRGIAQALLVKSMKMFREMGFDHTALGVDTENATGAFHLYEKVGYRQVRSTAVFRKQINL